MAYDAFLKLDGIKGESMDAKHKGEIDIMSFSWGLTQTGTHGVGGGGGAGKVNVQDISITKKVDSASPLLFLNCASGTHIKEGTLVVRKAGGTQLEYLKIKLTDVLVSSYEPYGETGATGAAPAGSAANLRKDKWHVAADEIPLEEVSLNFGKVEYSYQPQGADGKAQGGPILAGWDVKANQKV
jgi:type VI secretion system secreted protein Hcp